MHSGNKTLGMVIAEQCAKMMAIGLEGKPFHRDNEYDLMLEVWQDALEDAGFRDCDAPKIAKCWRAMYKTQARWFAPAKLIQAVRAIPSFDATPALEHRPEEINKEGLKRIAELRSGIGLVVNE